MQNRKEFSLLDTPYKLQNQIEDFTKDDTICALIYNSRDSPRLDQTQEQLIMFFLVSQWAKR